MNGLRDRLPPPPRMEPASYVSEYGLGHAAGRGSGSTPLLSADARCLPADPEPAVVLTWVQGAAPIQVVTGTSAASACAICMSACILASSHGEEIVENHFRALGETFPASVTQMTPFTFSWPKQVLWPGPSSGVERVALPQV